MPRLRSSAIFLSTLPARGATSVAEVVERLEAISIHAPREGSDVEDTGYKLPSLVISIHAPREGSDAARPI